MMKEQRLDLAGQKASPEIIKRNACRGFRFSLSAAVFLLFSVYSNAQCAMCRAALESEGDVAKAEAVNDGIVYLMAIPYLLVAVVGFYVYRTRFAKKT